jgi:hypothetical protein
MENDREPLDGETLLSLLFDRDGDEHEEGCSRDWDDNQCSGPLIWRTTSGGFHEQICQGHLDSIQRTLELIGQRYPEIYHEENCTCWGCSEASH